MSLKKYLIPAATIALGVLFLLIPGLEPFGAIAILSGLGVGGLEAVGHGK